MSGSRNLATRLPLFLAFVCTLPLVGTGDRGEVAIVTTSGVPALSEAVEGIRAQLGVPAIVVDLNDSEHGSILQQISKRFDVVLIAVGADALQSLAQVKAVAPVVSTMMLHESETAALSSHSGAFRPAASVHLDLSLAALLPEIGSMFPGKRRLGVIRNPARAGESDALAGSRGFTIELADCSHAEELLATFLSFKGRVDFVIVSPDSALYNSATVKPLVLASLANRLPLIGFSASFVRSGAAIGIYPDFRDIGRQTAELVNTVRAKRPLHPIDEGPRKWVVGINPRALRLLGLEHGPPLNAELVVVR